MDGVGRVLYGAGDVDCGVFAWGEATEWRVAGAPPLPILPPPPSVAAPASPPPKKKPATAKAHLSVSTTECARCDSAAKASLTYSMLEYASMPSILLLYGWFIV